VNFSLDSLDPEKFHRLTRWGSLEDVWVGIQAAEEAGLVPIKINVVVVRNYSEPEILALAGITLERDWQVRFIEMMPFGGATEFQRSNVVTTYEVQQAIEREYGPLEIINGGSLDGEARIYKIPSSLGSVGFISTVSAPFCSTCTRVRLTADGRLRLCLLDELEVDLLTPLRQGADHAELRELIVDAIWNKPWGNHLAEGTIPLNRAMSEIGG
jgi:cyclic pyranopterin phosphate synthase